MRGGTAVHTGSQLHGAEKEDDLFDMVDLVTSGARDFVEAAGKIDRLKQMLPACSLWQSLQDAISVSLLARDVGSSRTPTPPCCPSILHRASFTLCQSPRPTNCKLLKGDPERQPKT
jgi:hypothetical protein